MNVSALAATSLLLFALAFIAAIVSAAAGYAVDWESVAMAGAGCGLFSLVIACFVRERIAAGSIVLLSLLSTILAGPSIGFLFLFGLTTGLGAVTSLLGTLGEPGMEGVASQSLGLLAMAAITALCFVSQAWAILRARQAWQRAR